ncbi:hypothetical protein [uncultured Winogradskyella sp.]|uniref:hypothetical protein n=1 Tax=uncultured Winogradskyella sp. TaxID=395353 RepID=UPI0030D8AE26|tara:strand:+ start:1235 stop:1897 length:663 start_codon:yes stop_codon:yes gene_type:complete
MKRLFIVIVVFSLVSCNSTQLIESWKNPEITTYSPSKVLVVGLTSNIDARQKFENKLRNELEMRGAEAVSSLDIFKTEKMTEIELKELENNLINNGFDTVLFSKVIGVENKIVYKNDYDGYDETYRKFSEDYLRYQDVFYNPEYYSEFTIYHAETSMYCICPLKDRELIWKGYIDIVDPESVDETINNYANIVIAVLEELQLVNPKTLLEEKLTEDITIK